MKRMKTVMMVMLMVMTMFSTGCQGQLTISGSQPVIRSVQLTEKEQQLVTAVGVERIFAFDINLNKIDFSRLEYKVDYYENGEHRETVTHGSMGGFLEGGTHRFMWSQTNTGTNQEQLWHIAFAGSRMTQQIDFPEQLTAWTWGQEEQVESVEPNQPVMLAALVGTSTGTMRSPGVIFDETEGGLEALREYEAAYVLSISFNTQDFIEGNMEAMKNEEAEKNTKNQLEEKITGIEKKVDHLENDMPDQDLEQFIITTQLEFNRIEDLLHKVDGLETKYGIITGLNLSADPMETIFDVELADTQENIQIKADESCTVYMIGQFAKAPIETAEFLQMMEQDLMNDFQQGFTFKIVNGKAVQIYQGWGELN